MKYKVKKQMTLPEIIQWGWANEIKNESFIASLGGRINFDEDSYIDIEEDNLIAPEETFEVEVEEEVTENTKLPTLIELFVSDYVNDYGQIMHMYHNESINGAIGDVEDDTKALSKAFYMLNDDLSMTLIWRNGEMVE